MNVDATRVYPEEWRDALQAQLSEPTKWKTVCRVDYSNYKTIHYPYLTDPTVQTLTRGTVTSPQKITETDETMTIATGKELTTFIDWADLAQAMLFKGTDAAKVQARLLNEQIESAFYADHANLTDFGVLSIGGGGAATDPITVSTANVYKIVTGIKREIGEANGVNLMSSSGVFIVWRYADFEILEQFAFANGYSSADAVLRKGLDGGVEYFGVTHYASNLLAANHVIAGVKGVYNIGILKDTYGKLIVNPYNQGDRSGITFHTRVDYGVKAWTRTKPVLFDVNVS